MCFLLALATLESVRAVSVSNSWGGGNADADEVCYFGMVHGDACSISADGDDDGQNQNQLPSNPKNASCLAHEISSVIKTDLQKVSPKSKSSTRNLLRSPLTRPSELEPLYAIGDMVEFRAHEVEPAPPVYSYYPCVTRGIQQATDQFGRPYLKYIIERLMDGVVAAVRADVLKPYDKYKRFSPNMFCRIEGTNPISDPEYDRPFAYCRVVADHFPDWIVEQSGEQSGERSEPHSRAESFLNGQYTIVYNDEPGVAHRIPAHDMFSFEFI